MRYILLSSGNIPVDRKSKDRQILFKGTIEALSTGQAVALFPEGTSYTEPRIMQVKDGAAWAALEYCKWLQNNPGKASDTKVVIVPSAIVYTNKSKYRSSVRHVTSHSYALRLKKSLYRLLWSKDTKARLRFFTDPCIRFGRPITMDEYMEQFLSSEEGASRAAVKRLTRKIQDELVEATINAPDWYEPFFHHVAAHSHMPF